MLRRFCLPLVITIASFLSSAAFSQETKAPPKAPLASLDLKDGDSFVFLGDSITHQCLYTQYVEDFFYQRYPGRRVNFHNAGVGGARALDALDRIEKDVLSLKPRYVTILLGMNDGSYTTTNVDIFNTYRKDMSEVVRRITESSATPILMTPTMFDSRAARIAPGRWADPETLAQYNGVLANFGHWLRDVALENGYGFADLHGPLNQITFEMRKTNPGFTIIRDAVHPDEPGQLVMAWSLLKSFVPDEPFSQIHGRIRDGKVELHAHGGTIENPTLSDSGIEFRFRAEGLPWIVPQYRDLLSTLHVDHLPFNKEEITINGLPPGEYEVLIDDSHLTTTTVHGDGRFHLHWHHDPRSPQVQQSLRVAELNHQRNRGPVVQLRNTWGQFQNYARLKRAVEANGNNAEIKTRFEEAQKAVVDIDERVASLRNEARSIEDEIYKANQPVFRRYVIKRTAR